MSKNSLLSFASSASFSSDFARVSIVASISVFVWLRSWPASFLSLSARSLIVLSFSVRRPFRPRYLTSSSLSSSRVLTFLRSSLAWVRIF